MVWITPGDAAIPVPGTDSDATPENPCQPGFLGGGNLPQ